MTAKRRPPRPEWRWAWVGALAGALIAGVITIKAISSSGSSTAVIGLLFIWIPMGLTALPCALWGAAIGHVVTTRGKRRDAGRRSKALFFAAIVTAIALPVYAGFETWRGLSLQAEVRAVAGMEAVALDAALDSSRWNHNKFFLGAIARNKAAGPAVLDRIASLDDPELFESMGSMLWDVMGLDNKGIATMRVLARNGNTGAETLAKLAAHPRVHDILYELLANPNTPDSVVARWYDSTDYIAEWGLALNPRLPLHVYERLSRSENLYTRMNLTNNKGTPEPILEKLTKDPDQLLARNAGRALERRQNSLQPTSYLGKPRLHSNARQTRTTPSKICLNIFVKSVLTLPFSLTAALPQPLVLLLGVVTAPFEGRDRPQAVS